MKSRKTSALLAVSILLSMIQASAQNMDTHLVAGTPGFNWPQAHDAAVQANRVAEEKMASFLNSLRANVPEYLPIRVGSFRFVPLEKGRYYLVAVTGDRFYWNIDAVIPEGQGFQYSEMVSNGPSPLAMQAVDLDGDGVYELVTAEWPAGYQGASTPAIYWYGVWRFRDGVPYDGSAQFPDFYRVFVLGQFSYIEQLLSRLQSADPDGVRVPLAEIEYVRLKYERVILGKKNSGLEQALTWIESKDTALQNMGVWSLAEMPAAAAGEALEKLAQSRNFADMAKAALARRARLLRKEVPK